MSDFDHAAQAQSRIYNQYHDKQKTVEWMRIHGTLCNELEGNYCDVAESYDIDSATTYELDVLGRIVVIGREFEAQVPFNPDQFGGSPSGIEVQFGGDFQFEPTAGKSGDALNNEIYRLLIRAKIAKNNSDATIDSIILALGEIVKSSTAKLVDHEDMSFTVEFTGPLTEVEKLVLTEFDIAPRPQGVKLRGFVDDSTIDTFGQGQFGQSQFSYAFGG